MSETLCATCGKTFGKHYGLDCDATDTKRTWKAGEGAMREPTTPLEHAAKLLALSLTDEMIDSLRADYGNTNAAVLIHWKAEVLAANTHESRSPDGDGPNDGSEGASADRLKRLPSRATGTAVDGSEPSDSHHPVASERLRALVEQLKQIRARVQEAPPSPWRVEAVDDDDNPPWILRDARGFAMGDVCSHKKLHVFLSSAREDMLWLVDQLTALLAEAQQENVGCVCQVEDGLVQEWVSNARAVARIKGHETSSPLEGKGEEER